MELFSRSCQNATFNECNKGQYECLDRSQQDTRSHVVDEDYYMQCDTNEGNQPIYGNTEQMYYNYAGPLNQADDDVYIMPDA
ncbi:hypothetical protein NDU88_005560 [Pleurodeles waltl]|uniref:Uncharacterized protein n=1 Tax=Pleurodeles waltl TaxID=8319 RepID=A0AAV7L7V5_PLEWA|nr:hypothetical protein NDU88_005560 [Pleurodeles waltl]